MPISNESRNLLNQISPETANPWQDQFYTTQINLVIRQFLEDDFDLQQAGQNPEAKLEKITTIQQFVDNPNHEQFQDFMLKDYLDRFEQVSQDHLPGIVSVRFNESSLKIKAVKAYQSLIKLEVVDALKRLVDEYEAQIQAAGAIPQNAQADIVRFRAWIEETKLRVIAESAITMRQRFEEFNYWLFSTHPKKAWNYFTNSLPNTVLVQLILLKDVALHFPNPRKSIRQNLFDFLFKGILAVFFIPIISLASFAFHTSLFIIHFPSLIISKFQNGLYSLFNHRPTALLVVALLIAKIYAYISILSVFSFVPVATLFAQVAMASVAAYAVLGLVVGPIVQLGRLALSYFGYNTVDNQKDIGLGGDDFGAILVSALIPEIKFTDARNFLTIMTEFFTEMFALRALVIEMKRRDINNPENFVHTVQERQDAFNRYHVFMQRFTQYLSTTFGIVDDSEIITPLENTLAEDLGLPPVAGANAAPGVPPVGPHAPVVAQVPAVAQAPAVAQVPVVAQVPAVAQVPVVAQAPVLQLPVNRSAPVAAAAQAAIAREALLQAAPAVTSALQLHQQQLPVNAQNDNGPEQYAASHNNAMSL